MQATFEQWRQRLVDEAMALQRFQTHELAGHDSQAEVPPSGRGVADVRGGFVPYLEMQRREPLLQQTLDALGGGGGRGDGLQLHEGRGTHEACAARTSGREVSQAACAIANSANATVSPKNLKFTQSRSLQ